MAEIRNRRSLLGLCPVSGHIEDALGLRALIIKELGGVIDYQTRVIMLVRGEGGDTVEYLPTEYILAFIHVDLPDFQRIVLKNDLMIDDGDTI